MLTFLLLVAVVYLSWKNYKSKFKEFWDRVVHRFNKSLELADEKRKKKTVNQRLDELEKELEKLRKEKE